MIPLKEWEYSLITRIEKENCTTYGIREIDGDYYIKTDDLMSLIDETQDYRDYAEEQIIELNNKLNDMPDVEVNSLQLSTVKALNELRIENDKLKQENEILRREVENVCNEDMLDRLNMEGVEL